MVETPHRDPRFLVWTWCLVVFPFLAVYAWLDHPLPAAFGPIARGVSPIYMGFKWLRFHPANESTHPGEHHIVVIGSSNFAGWGDDYRFSSRHRADSWGRHSFGANLERELRGAGIHARVSNLAVDGARLRSQIFLALYAMRSKPELVVFGLSTWTFIRDGDFLDPKPLIPMNTALEKLMDDFNPPVSEPSFMSYFQRQPKPRLRERLQVSAWDEAVAKAAKRLNGLYHKIGLPPSLVFPSPIRFVNEVRQMEEEARTHPGYDDLKPSPLFDEMAGIFPSAMKLLKSAADQTGTSLIVVAPPCASRWVNWFEGERVKEARQCGIRVMDLRGLPMHAEEQTYDGYHMTRRGNEDLARAFYQGLQPEGGLP